MDRANIIEILRKETWADEGVWINQADYERIADKIKALEPTEEEIKEKFPNSKEYPDITQAIHIFMNAAAKWAINFKR